MRTLLLRAALVAALFSLPALSQALTAGNWTVTNTPAVNVQATASRAASGINRTHVATSCSGSINTVAAQPGITLNLRDGATGAGTVLWTGTIACTIGAPCTLNSPLMNAPGTAATAMTCEWSAAPATGNFEVANLSGFDTGS